MFKPNDDDTIKKIIFNELVIKSSNIDNSSNVVNEEKREKKKFEIEFKELEGAKYKQGNRFKKTPNWIVVHYTAVIGASAKSCAKSYAKTDKIVSPYLINCSKDNFLFFVGCNTCPSPTCHAMCFSSTIL